MSLMIASRVSAGTADRVGALALFRAQFRVEQQFGHADHAVHRRADLVAHVGEKLALVAAGALGSLLSAMKFQNQSAPPAIEGEAEPRQRQYGPGADRGQQQEPKLAVPGPENRKPEFGRVAIDVAVAIHAPNLKPVLARRQAAEGRGSRRGERRPRPAVHTVRI